MSLVPTKEYTDPRVMAADYAERRRRLYARPVVVRVVEAPPPPEPEPPAEPEPVEVAEEVPTPRRLARHILAETCQRHGLRIECVLGDRRHLPLVLCRREAAWLIAKETNLSWPQIGAVLNKDHTTILMATRRQNEITGENVRGVGGIPEKTLRRNRAAAAERKLLPLSVRQRLRKNKMARSREDFRL